MGREKPLELAFEDISNFDSKNPVVDSLLKKLDVGGKKLANDLIKQPSDPSGIIFPSEID